MPRVTRSFTTLGRRFATLAIAVLVAGCASPPPRLNAPPQGWSSRQADMQQHYVYMTDNAMLAEMDVTDVHFVPHSGDLNSLGARRLDRYAALLKESGGQLAYDTQLTDAKVVQARLASIKVYLEAAGADPCKITVVQGPCGEAPMSADEASMVRQKMLAGGDQSKQQDSSGGMLGQAATSSD